MKQSRSEVFELLKPDIVRLVRQTVPNAGPAGGGGGASLADINAAIATHRAESDPHPVYLTESEADALYAALGHTHDDRYYTKAQADDRFVNIDGDTITGVLLFDEGADLVSTDYVSRTTGWRITQNGEGDFRDLYADHVILDDGVQTTPALQVGSTEDGLYQPGTNILGFVTDQVERMRLTTEALLFTEAHDVGSDNYASQLTGWKITYEGAADFRYVYTDQMHAKAFIADLEQALAGGQIITKSVATLAAPFTVPNPGETADITLHDLPSAHGMAFAEDGDIIRLRSFSRAAGELTITDAWGTVTDYVDNADGTQTWTFTRSGSIVYDTPVVRATSTASITAATTLTINKPTGTANTDFLLAMISYVDQSSVAPPSGWTLVRQQQSADCTMEVYKRTAGGSEPASYSWTFAGNADAYGVIRGFTSTVTDVDAASGQTNSSDEIVEYFAGWSADGSLMGGLIYDSDFSGWSADGSLGTYYSPLATGGTIEITAPGVDPVSNAGYLILAAAVAGNVRATPPSGMTEEYDVASGGAGIYMATEQLSASDPTGDKTATLASSASNNAVLIVLMPAIAGYSGGAGGMDAGTVIEADAVVLDYGVSGNGWYEVNAIDGLYGVNSPYMQILDWADHPLTGANLRVRIGNLNGLTGFADKWGAYFAGAADTEYIAVTQDGISLRNTTFDLYDGTDRIVSVNVGNGVDIEMPDNAIDYPKAYTFSKNGDVIGSFNAYYGTQNHFFGIHASEAGYGMIFNLHADSAEDLGQFDLIASGYELSAKIRIDCRSLTDSRIWLDAFYVELSNSGFTPSDTPDGGYLYVQNGELKYKGNSGTVTTLASA